MNNPNSKPIICGTDFSGPARAGADAAAALATRLDVPLLLVHASEIAGSPLTHEHLREEAQRLRDAGADLVAQVVEGVADEVLAQVAQQHQARLLVVSSVGRRAPARWLLGSVAERTAESAPVPTLVVRDAAPFEAWARGQRALKVLVGADFSANSAAALAWVAELRQFGPCEVIAAYAAGKPEEAARLGITGPLGLVENPPIMLSVLERDIKERVTGLLGGENVRTAVQLGWWGAEVGLVEMATEAQADLIVVGTHQRHGLSRLWQTSVSRGILHFAPMNVACVPTPAAKRMMVPRLRECRRVLVAVDLNESHGFAAPYAYGIVKPGGTVLLLHNVVPYDLPNPLIGGSYQEFGTKKGYLQLISESEAQLRSLTPAEAEESGIVTEVEVTEDWETAKAICAAAERFNADVICIGSHTRPGFVARAMGSVALGVLTQCRRPVLVVWPPVQ